MVVHIVSKVSSHVVSWNVFIVSKDFFSEQVNSICTLAYRVIRIGKCDQILNLFTYPKCHSIPFISDGFGTMIANKELHLVFF